MANEKNSQSNSKSNNSDKVKKSDKIQNNSKSTNKKSTTKICCCVAAAVFVAIVIFILIVRSFYRYYTSPFQKPVPTHSYFASPTAAPPAIENPNPPADTQTIPDEQPPEEPPANPDNNAPQEEGISKQAQIDYFIKVAILVEDENNAEYPLRKWNKNNVTVQVTGQSTPQANQCLADTISTINSLSNTMKLSLTSGSGDIEMKMTDRATMEARGFPTGGFFIYDPPSGSYNLTGVVAYAATDYWPGEDVPNCHIIRHELTHAIGLPNNASGYDYSIFNVPSTATCDYQEIDKQMIKMLYNTGITAGLGEAQVRAFFANANW